MTIEQVAPAPARVELEQVLAELTAPGAPSKPFHHEIIAFCADFSRRIFRDEHAGRYPELQALAFWMRKAELARLAVEFEQLQKTGAILLPRGLVFHVPPANVDTIFIYSWLVSVLTGNRNIIRLSPRAAEQTTIICRVFNEAMASAPESLRHNTAMLRYGHEREITEAISARADVRILWGGDASVNALRSIPLPPHAKELTFSDRFSFAAIRAARYLASDSARRKQLAADFFNDVFWFDQMACSSPRLLVWVGTAEESNAASENFLRLVQGHAQHRAYRVQPQTRLSRFSFACRAVMDGRATGYRDLGEFVLLDVGTVRDFDRGHCGGGLLFQTRIEALAELEPFISRRDQTMTHFGFDTSELTEFAMRLNGLDRIVPVGQALNFNRFWDGYDLLQELTRHVSIG
ncbi:MAG TPA: acyl-CoA reductase [Bryobacteraceae bacterium]|nr:acyl-CoA reductase [Bryobacteraceae bacterium]